MKAVVLEDLGRVAVRDVPEPELLDPRDAIVRVSRAAICGSDLHFLHGKAPLDPGETIGHEAVGVIEGVGGAVDRFGPGDRVVAAFHVACGACWFCRAGQTQLCEDWRMLGGGVFGGGLAGAQAELVRVPVADVNLLAVPDDVDDEAAVFLGDVLTTGWYGAAISRIAPHEIVAVVGVGPVGLCAVQAVVARGAARVVALDVDADRLAIAERSGATPVNVRERHPQMALAEFTDGRGADVAIDAVGRTDALETAVEVVRRGGRVTVLGVYTHERLEVQVGVWSTRAIDVRFGGLCPVHAWWDEVLAEVRAGRLDPRPIVSHRLPLADAVEGYALFDARRATKVLLEP